MIDDPPVMQDPETPESRIKGLLAKRAAYLQQPFMGEPGVADKKVAMREATRQLMAWGDATGGKDEFKNYIKTGELSPGLANWAQPSGVETQPPADGEDFRQWVVEPLANIGMTAIDWGIVAPVRGVANLFGAGIEPVDLKAKVRAGAKWFKEGGDPKALYEEQLQSQQDLASRAGPVGKVLQGAASTVGGMAGLTTAGPAKAILGAGGFIGKTAANIAAKIAGGEKAPKIIEMISKGAGAFGAYEAVTAQPGERLQGLLHGVIAGPVMEITGAFGKAAFERIMRMGGADSAALTKALGGFAKKEGIPKLQSESGREYSRRLIGDWINSGMPGWSMPGRKLAAIGARGLIEGAGFSMLDATFMQDLVAGTIGGDEAAAARAIEKYATNALGMAFFHAGMSLKDVPRMQRARPSEPPIDVEFEVRHEPAPEGTKQLPYTAKGFEEKVGAEGMKQFGEAEAEAAAKGEKYPRSPGMTDLETAQAADARRQREAQDPGEQRRMEAQRTAEEAARTKDVTQYPQTGELSSGLKRLGWTKALPQEPQPMPKAPVEGKPGEANTPEQQALVAKIAPPAEKPAEPTRVEIPDSPYYFNVEGGVARPSPKLREALQAPEEMPLEEFTRKLEKASLISSLQSLAIADGTVIDTQGIVKAKGDKMYTIRFGEPLVKPLSPGGSWKPATDMPARGADEISPMQQITVRNLLDIAKQRPDLLPEDRAVLGSVIAALDTVAAEKDVSVQETMQNIQSLLPVIAQAAPEQAGAAIKALAEMMTTKSPQVALQDLQATVTKSPLEKVGEAEKISAEDGFGKCPQGECFSGATKLASEIDGDVVHGQVTMDGKTFAHAWVEKGGFVYDPTLGAKFPAATFYVRTDAKIDARYSWPKAMARMVREGHHGPWADKPEPSKAQEPTEAMGGFPLPKAAREFASGLGELAVEAGGKIGERFYRGLVDRVRKLGAGKAAEMGRAAVAKAREIRQRVYRVGLSDLMRATKRPIAELEELVVDQFGGATTRGGAMMDEPARKHFKVERGGLSQKAQKVFDQWHDVIVELAKVAEEMNLPFVNAPGKGITGDAARYRLPGVATPEWREAMVSQSGPLWEAFSRWVESVYGKTPEQVSKDFSEARSLIGRDPTEFVRKYPVLPTRLRVGEHWVQIRVDTAREHAEMLAERSASILGARSQFRDPEKDVVREAGAEEFEEGELPLPASHVVNDVLNERGNKTRKEAAQATADMLRALHGLPVSLRPAWTRSIAPAGSKAHDALTLVRAVFGDLLKSANLSMAFAMNAFEVVADAQFLGGIGALTRARGELVRRGLDGTLDQAQKEFAAEGWMRDEVPNYRLKGANTLESFADAAKTVGDLIRKPLTVTQDDLQLTVMFAGKARLEAMQEGYGNHNDAVVLRGLGFSPADAQRMIDGKGTEAEYKRYAQGMLGWLVGGRQQAGAEKSWLAHNPAYNSLFAFTHFFMRRTAQTAQLFSEMLKAEPGDKWQSRQRLAQFLLMNSIGGTAGTLLGKFIWDGLDGMVDWIREAQEDIPGTITSVLSSALVGGMGQPLKDIVANIGKSEKAEEHVGVSLSRLVYPVNQTLRLYDFMRSMLGVEIPGYEGKDKLGKVAHYVRGAMPLARAAHEGLFGMASLAFTEADPRIDRAQDSLFRFKKEHGLTKDSDPDPQSRAFRAAMHKAIDRVKVGDGVGDEALMEHIAEAMSAYMEQSVEAGVKPSLQKAKQAVAASLRNMKALPSAGNRSWTPDKRALLEEWLGEDNLTTLQEYDAVIDYLAKRFGGSR